MTTGRINQVTALSVGARTDASVGRSPGTARFPPSGWFSRVRRFLSSRPPRSVPPPPTRRSGAGPGAARRGVGRAGDGSSGLVLRVRRGLSPGASLCFHPRSRLPFSPFPAKRAVPDRASPASRERRNRGSSVQSPASPSRSPRARARLVAPFLASLVSALPPPWGGGKGRGGRTVSPSPFSLSP